MTIRPIPMVGGSYPQSNFHLWIQTLVRGQKEERRKRDGREIEERDREAAEIDRDRDGREIEYTCIVIVNSAYYIITDDSHSTNMY